MSSHQLFDSLQAVRDETTFLGFVDALAADRQTADRLLVTLDGHQAEWANQTIAEFLLAAGAWAKDSGFGIRSDTKSENPWQLFAAFLWAGRGYE